MIATGNRKLKMDGRKGFIGRSKIALPLVDPKFNFHVDQITRVGVLLNFLYYGHELFLLTIFLFPVKTMANQNEWLCKSQGISYIYCEQFP